MTTTTGIEHKARRQLQMLAVFKKLATIWPKAFAPSVREGLLDTWLDACVGLDTDLLEPAARALILSAPQYPPKPWDLATHGRKLMQKHTPALAERATSGPIRAWQWRDPVSQRGVLVEEWLSGWSYGSIGVGASFHAMPDAVKAQHCDDMVREHGW